MFYERITKLCSERGTTITTVLKELKLSTAQGTQWKNGSLPQTKTLTELADYFNVSTDYLLGSDEIKKRPTPEEAGRLAEYMKSEEFRHFSELFMKLTPDEQKKVREHAELIERARSHKDE